jgi:hypothetical protein
MGVLCPWALFVERCDGWATGGGGRLTGSMNLSSGGIEEVEGTGMGKSFESVWEEMKQGPPMTWSRFTKGLRSSRGSCGWFPQGGGENFRCMLKPRSAVLTHISQSPPMPSSDPVGGTRLSVPHTPYQLHPVDSYSVPRLVRVRNAP